MTATAAPIGCSAGSLAAACYASSSSTRRIAAADRARDSEKAEAGVDRNAQQSAAPQWLISARSRNWLMARARWLSSTTPSCRPLWQQPIALGADLVVHSTTKYLNGHSDVVGGVVVAATAELQQQLEWWGNATGIVGRAVRQLPDVAGTAHARRPAAGSRRQCSRRWSVCYRRHSCRAKQSTIRASARIRSTSSPEATVGVRCDGQFRVAGGLWQQCAPSSTDCNASRLRNPWAASRASLRIRPRMTHAALDDETRERAGISPGLITAVSRYRGSSAICCATCGPGLTGLGRLNGDSRGARAKKGRPVRAGLDVATKIAVAPATELTVAAWGLTRLESRFHQRHFDRLRVEQEGWLPKG